jgi:hypothetical protein
MAVRSLKQNELGASQNDAMKQLTITATTFLPLSFIRDSSASTSAGWSHTSHPFGCSPGSALAAWLRAAFYSMRGFATAE